MNVELIQNAFLGAGGLVWKSFRNVLAYPVTPGQRFFWPYLLTSLGLGCVSYVLARAGRGGARQRPESGILSFLFPRYVWTHPSTWVDIRYFFPHQLVRVWIYSTFILLSFGLVSQGVRTSVGALLGPEPVFAVEMTWLGIAVYTLAVSMLADFGAFFVHYLQHHWSSLWVFHKVHHSVTVLNPLSNYREHPVDNLSYAMAHGSVLGLSDGLALSVLGWQPNFLAVAGVMLPFLLFNVVGYHLRHSHIWLRWPGPFGIIFGSPAHHQIHHSCRPEHINKNMAFMFPVWDVLFGTYCLPEEEPELTLGLGDGTDERYSGFFRIYGRPFRELLGLLHEART
jgi:sterol desaturase/sphingolipid hydroxylase (fatty acid hydroxylase superfamily)